MTGARIKEYARTIVTELSDVFSRLDENEITSFEDLIIKARRIIVIGVGREGLAARAFTMRLMHLGKDVHWVWDDTTPSLAAGDLLIAVSGCGKIGHIQYVIDKAREQGASVAVVTGDPGQKAVEHADSVLFVPAAVYLGTADVVKSIQPMGNLFEQSLFIVFDMIVMDLADTLHVLKSDMERRHRNIE
jgi:6-phospho-3-hexuloisomerase